MMDLQVNQIVKGKTEKSHFVILGFRTIDNTEYAQVKCCDIETGKTYAGEFALPVDILRPAQ